MWILAITGKVEASNFGNSDALRETAIFPVCGLTGKELAKFTQITAVKIKFLSMANLKQSQERFAADFR